MPPAALREPWAAPPAQLAAAGVRLGDTYPMPIVAHDAARRRTTPRARLHLRQPDEAGAGAFNLL
ncbi:hypothetical protein AQ610_06530 [Burkholderia humptydooensis]|uniref:Cryptochrome/DNA photolyase FAD-binding domain-containing protein n=1 Tax=Burkholderia humptydooensis MSMB43 TaxID=441157 RepID=A0ABN0G9E0_9BURK|nr:hypothetical protein AQ610_06530 [Burkholderia humptydooensis]EIP88801.1 hypothetical protein A33K_14901 [Burkholderia humptydooensis MSMB43]